MGLINSHLLLLHNDHDKKRNKLAAAAYNEDDDVDTPVMGDGYCPIYDAASVGDWKRLIMLCKEAIISSSEDDQDQQSMSTARRMDWIVSLDVFDGGHDYSYSLDLPFGEEGEGGGGQKQKQQSSSSQEWNDVQSSSQQQPSLNNKEEKHGDESTNSIKGTQSNNDELHNSTHNRQQSQPQQQPYSLFIDAKGNTPLHLACRRDPPLSAIRALLALHPPSIAWMKTHDGWIPLHLACHCGCDVEVANELLVVMEELLEDEKNGCFSQKDQQQQQEEEEEGQAVVVDVDDDDPLLPRDVKGRTPLHLACASSRDPLRRPDLVRLLLLRSTNPKKAALARDWVDFDQRVGLDLALGELSVIVGGLNLEHGSIGDNRDNHNAIRSNGNSRGIANGARNSIRNGGGSATSNKQQSAATITSVGRTPLNLVEDDYREELEEALLPGFSIANALIAACGGDKDEDAAVEDDLAKMITTNSNNLDSFYECWATLSILLLAAGTPGTVERVKEALGGMVDDNRTTRNVGDNADDPLLSGSSFFSKPCHDVVQDFQAIHKACQTLEGEEGSSLLCPPQFKVLAKKFLAGQVDKRTMGSVSDLKNKWESRSSNGSISLGSFSST
eukprot:CAMPEP_0172322456 /NCGR_PEP_ID=MMETSP1058-20130122/45906_1 /TAXON_ID=83371 /ORGANISM="Detonula confervacea, Strain CCMP 353" /LENGTH=613 /DNA_ID=CAMNT_0013038197 /DNA_START=233 /DNA_END=2074 /DNA_ORIENTATION=+